LAGLLAALIFSAFLWSLRPAESLIYQARREPPVSFSVAGREEGRTIVWLDRPDAPWQDAPFQSSVSRAGRSRLAELCAGRPDWSEGRELCRARAAYDWAPEAYLRVLEQARETDPGTYLETHSALEPGLTRGVDGLVVVRSPKLGGRWSSTTPGLVGRITLDGRPLAGVPVRALRATGPHEMFRITFGCELDGLKGGTSLFPTSVTRTDARGRFAFENLASTGNYLLAVRFDGLRNIQVENGCGPLSPSYLKPTDAGTLRLVTRWSAER
jgi:hypothetical protein